MASSHVAIADCLRLSVAIFARYRHRLNARKRLDIAVGVAPVFLWALYFYRFA
tara:strand:+ start:1552 stop:1710 length:159 start_codon:yes stop_codon:yes gene_type:complete